MTPPRRRIVNAPITKREQFVIDQAAAQGKSGALNALGISNADEFRTLWPSLSVWFTTMQAKDKAAMEVSNARKALWHRAWELISKAGVEEGVKWAFRLLAVGLVLLAFYVVGHKFVIPGSVLSGILGSG